MDHSSKQLLLDISRTIIEACLQKDSMIVSEINISPNQLVIKVNEKDCGASEHFFEDLDVRLSYHKSFFKGLNICHIEGNHSYMIKL